MFTDLAVRPEANRSRASLTPTLPVQETLANFDNLSWDQQVQTLKNVIEILNIEGGQGVILSNIRQVCIVTSTALSSLRSMVVRVGISTLTALFFRLGQSMDSEIDFLMNPVVKKASDGGNKFIRDEALELLNVMSITTSQVSLCKSLLDHVLSKNDAIRKVMAGLIAKCLQKSSSKIIANRHLVSRLVTTLATLLGDKSATVREVARNSLLLIRNSLGKARFLKLSSSALSSAVMSAIDIADNQSRNRYIRSAPQVRKAKIGPLQPLMTSRRPDPLSRVGSECSDDGLGNVVVENAARRQTVSSNTYKRRFCAEPELTGFKAPINDEGFSNRRTTICAIDGKMLMPPDPPVPPFRGNKFAISQPKTRQIGYDQFSSQGERTLAPRIFELSLLHSRMKPCTNDAEARNRRASEMFIAGRSAGETLLCLAESGLQAGRRRSYHS